MRPSRAAIAAGVSGLLTGATQPIVVRALGQSPLDPTGVSGLFVLVTMVPLFLAVRGANWWRAMKLGFLASYLQLFVIVHWVMYPFSDFRNVPEPLAFVIMLILGVMLVPVIALGWGAAAFIVERTRTPWWLAGPVAVTAAELLRNYQPFGGDPFGNVGMSLVTIDLLRQGASAVGVYGLVFCVLLVNGVIAEVVARRKEGLPTKAVLTAVVLLIVWIGWGMYRLSPDPTKPETVKAAILQASIDQNIINDPSGSAEEVRKVYYALQDEALAKGARFVIWPEGALVPAVDVASERLNLVVSSSTSTTPPASLIGAMAGFYEGPQFTMHSSAYVLDDELKVQGRFDKVHLVPLGEYVPWPLSPFIGKVVPGNYAIAPGRGHYVSNVDVDGKKVPLGVTICYEGAFPEITRKYVDGGARLMVNLTNDAWFGISSQPLQHMLMYSMRATESGRTIIRAANSGISAWVDPRGRVHDATKINARRVVVMDAPLSSERTLYQSWGEWWAGPCFIVTLILVFLGFEKRKLAWSDYVVLAGLVFACVIGWLVVFASDGLPEQGRTFGALAAVASFGIACAVRTGGRFAGLFIRFVCGVGLLICGLGLMFGQAWVLLPGMLCVGLYVFAWRSGAFRDSDVVNQA